MTNERNARMSIIASKALGYPETAHSTTSGIVVRGDQVKAGESRETR